MSIHASMAADEVEDGAASPGKAARIHRALEERFGNGYYRFGEELSVNKLSAEFRSSRQPVMMALRELRSDGFVIVKPQVGCRAAAPDRREIEDFFSVFARMEGRIAGLAAERHSPKQLKVLTDTLERIESSSRKPDQLDVEGINEFQAQIRTMANSPTLANRLSKFWLMSNYLLKNGQPSYSQDMHEIGNRERRNIHAAIVDRDRDFADLLMEKHILGKPRRAHLL